MENRETTSRKTYRVRELAEMLGVSKSTAYNLVNSGAIQAIRVNGLVLIPAEAVDRLLKKNDC